MSALNVPVLLMLVRMSAGMEEARQAVSMDLEGHGSNGDASGGRVFVRRESHMAGPAPIHSHGFAADETPMAVQFLESGAMSVLGKRSKDASGHASMAEHPHAQLQESAKLHETGSGSGDEDDPGFGETTGYTAEYGDLALPMVNVTAESQVSAGEGEGPLKAVDAKAKVRPPPESTMEKIGEGIGAMAYERSPTASRILNHDLRQRLQLQDFITVILLLSVFMITVLLSCFSIYQVADDTSPAVYYSEPKNYLPRVICDSNNADSFLAAFNTQPQNVRLRITGKNPSPGGFSRFLRDLDAHASRSRGLAALLPVRQRRRQAVLFDVALDLTPFITGDGTLDTENVKTLEGFLHTNNHLESLVLQKKVDWPLWEDVATNIRQRLRTLGFPGEVEIRFEAHDEVLVYQNHKWSNFVRNRVTQALVVISIFGSAFWVPYVWARSKVTKVESRFQINVDPNRYWELVQDGLSAADGFQNM